MTVERRAEDTASLIQALHDLDAAYCAAIERADDVIAALARGDSTQVQDAVVAQDAALRTIVGLERRRRAIQTAVEPHPLGREIAGELAHRSPHAIGAGLLEVLPPDEEESLRAARYKLLLTMRDLQSRHEAATMMLQNAQTVIKRLLRAQGAIVSYGPDGEPVLLGQSPRRRAVRRA